MRAQLLAATRPASLLEVVRGLTVLQIDATAAVAAGTDVLRVAAPGRAEVALPVVRTGEAAGVAFDPRVLVAALDTGVGPDVVLEIAGPCAPVVVRSADQGTFTTLAMPIRPDASVAVDR